MLFRSILHVLFIHIRMAIIRLATFLICSIVIFSFFFIGIFLFPMILPAVVFLITEEHPLDVTDQVVIISKSVEDLAEVKLIRMEGIAGTDQRGESIVIGLNQQRHKHVDYVVLAFVQAVGHLAEGL